MRYFCPRSLVVSSTSQLSWKFKTLQLACKLSRTRRHPFPFKDRTEAFWVLSHFSGFVLISVPITHFPQVQYGQISQLRKHIGEYLKNCINCFSIVGIFKASQVQSSSLGTFYSAAFLGKRNTVTKDVQSLSFLFCKICTLYHYLQYKSSINDSTMTN